MTATGDGRAPPSVTLRPMSTEQFEQWQARSIRSYADDLARATGWPPEAALSKARKQFAELLPEGMGTDKTWIRLIVDEAGETEIGLNVFGFNEPARRLYDSLGYRVVATAMTKTIQPQLPGQ